MAVHVNVELGPSRAPRQPPVPTETGPKKPRSPGSECMPHLPGSPNGDQAGATQAAIAHTLHGRVFVPGMEARFARSSRRTPSGEHEMVKISFVTAAAVTALMGTAAAQAPPSASLSAPPSPMTAPSSATTSRGPGLVSGTPGLPQTIMIPGSPIPGMLLDNGNGTSTIMVPGSVPQVIPTPR